MDPFQEEDVHRPWNLSVQRRASSLMLVSSASTCMYGTAWQGNMSVHPELELAWHSTTMVPQQTVIII